MIFPKCSTSPLKQNIMNIIWPLSWWLALNVNHCPMLQMLPWPQEYLRSSGLLAPGYGSRQGCAFAVLSVLHPVISHFSAVFSVSWLLLFTHCPHFVHTCWVRAQEQLQPYNVQMQMGTACSAAQVPLCRAWPKGFRPSFLQVSSWVQVRAGGCRNLTSWI